PALSREELAKRAQALQRLQAAAASMGQMPDRQTAIAVWQKALTNRSAGVRQMAAQALERLGNPATEVCEDQECL
ncbi:MAG: hypothetical protein KGI52_17955, partial [Burkholderiales bacterium]|nr:hypothetical protein [Burkholderiales bacterium]